MTETQQAQQQAAINVVESLELVRCLLRVSIFHTCYLRGIFPENCFKEVPMAGLDGMVIKMLLPGKNKDARRLVEWVEHGLHDAVEKGYLETMTFGLCRDKEQTDLVEQFQYKFAYESDIVTMADSFGTDVAIPLSQSSQMDMKTVKYQIVRMMRMLIQICTTLGALPGERYVFMKLTYNQIAPVDYEPPFFRAAEENQIAQFPSRPFSLELGAVRTNFHEVALSVRSVCDLDDEGAPEYNRSEGQGQTTKHAPQAAAAKEIVPSQKVFSKPAALLGSAIEVGISSSPAATKGASTEDEPLLMDVTHYCLEGRTATIDLAAAKAKFVDADVASLERCFDALVLKGTLQAIPNHTGTYVVKGSTKAVEDIPAKESGAIKPASSAASKYRSQYADMNQDACGAGSCQTLSTGLKQARSMDALALNATSQSKMAGFPDTQDSNREGRKRKASRAEEPIYQHLGEGKVGNRLRLLKMQRKT